MKIKTDKQQVRERIEDIEYVIDWQKDKIDKCYKRYRIKTDWIFSFWILNNADTLHFVYLKEKKILEYLEDYKELIEDKLITME